VRSRSATNPEACNEIIPGFDVLMSDSHSNTGGRTYDTCCHYEIEVRQKVLSSKKYFLKNFFQFYLKSLMTVNE
jgi:hypothetical protein